MKTKLLKTCTKSLFIGMFLLSATACSDDSNDNQTPEPDPPVGPEPSFPVCLFRQIEVYEPIMISSPSVKHTQLFSFEEGHITSYVSRQSIDLGKTEEPFTLDYTTTVERNGQQATVTDESGNISVYTLDASGYASRCVRQEPGGNNRTYTFAYRTNDQGKRYLTEATETLNEEAQPYSTLRVEYDDNDSPTRIIQQITDATTVILFSVDPEKETTNTAEIPQHFFCELHPLSMHTAALYGKLLGEPWALLVAKLTLEDDIYEETHTFQYTTTPEGYIGTCRETIKSAGETYLRILEYSFE